MLELTLKMYQFSSLNYHISNKNILPGPNKSSLYLESYI